MFQKFVFRIILAAFGFILVPTNYWHDCEKPHNEHSDGGTHVDKGHSTCSICDFDLFQLDRPEFHSFKIPRTAIASCFSGKIVPCQSAPDSYFNKGPPGV